MGKTATIIDEDAEHVRAAHWRRRIMLMKHEQLAMLTGYSVRTIYEHEDGREYFPEDWLKYKMACAAVHAQKLGWTPGRKFDWRL